jgi:hypothetical protein
MNLKGAPMQRTLSLMSRLLVAMIIMSVVAPKQLASSATLFITVTASTQAAKWEQGSEKLEVRSAFGSSMRPPETIERYYALFVTVRSLTGFPFTLFPGLGGADRAKFIADDLINRDELIHTTTYLKGQFFIVATFSPDTAKELQATITVCEFLLHRFPRLATQKDAQGSQALSEADVAALFVAVAAERTRSRE